MPSSNRAGCCGRVTGAVLLFLGLSIFMVCGIGASARAQGTFYEDKTIRMVIGFSAGGISDLWGRAVARAMSPHIPGKPQIILHNMPGAGSLTAANYLYSV
ncbi:MAG TPA: hypothetical protein VFQ89_04370, partial [Candidatus Binatia bacterium]|nr:hypothetical protein [Candidatus Binatia bacterium]